MKELAGREEFLGAGIHEPVGNADGTGLTLRDVAYLLKLAEIIWLSKKNAKVVGVSRDACVRTVYRSYPVARLVFPFAFDTPGSPVVITFLLETGWRMQVEYDDCYGSTVSGAKR